jgi:hypothetical protein
MSATIEGRCLFLRTVNANTIIIIKIRIMSETIYEGYKFEGPFSISEEFNAVAGIYLITNATGVIIDVGETENLKVRIPSHERRDCWEKNGGIKLYFHFETNEQGRLKKEKDFREKSNPVCGVY